MNDKMRRLRWLKLPVRWLIGIAFLSLCHLHAPAQQHRVPEGFTIEKVASEPEVRFPMFATFDDRGRLFVAESSGGDLYEEISALTRDCRIRLLEDTDGDGRFETSRVFAERLNFPMGLVWRSGKLFVADPPELVTLEDTEGDGVADLRKVILTGFGHRDNGSLHGLTFGPDGWLYMTMGQPDGYRLASSDGELLEGYSGALLRCRPDGSEVEVVCRGFENLVEVVFLPTGEIIGTDNWFQRPSGGIRDALVHLVPGGLYPIQLTDRGSPQPITGIPLPAVSLYPAVALSGLEIYRGNAFPSALRGCLFSAQHNSRKVGRHVLVKKASTFEAEDADFVTSDDPDFHPSDVLEDADGTLLVVDTGSWYTQHCPTGRIRNSPAAGGIYRIRYEGSPTIDDPWGMAIEWDARSAEALVVRLGDARPAVRARSQRMLVRLGASAVEALSQAVFESSDDGIRLQALWTLAEISQEAALAPLRHALKESSPRMVITATRILGERADRNSAEIIGRMLTSDKSDPHLRRVAAESLARCGNEKALSFIWRALTEEDCDAFLEHALVHAAHCLAAEGALLEALDHPHPRVQKAALILLNQPPRSSSALLPDAVLQRVGSSDGLLRQTALEVLQARPGWVAYARRLIEDRLLQAGLSDEEKRGLGSLILAFQSDEAVQEAIGIALENTDSERRQFLLETLARTTLPEFPAAWVAPMKAALEDSDSTVRLHAARTLATLSAPVLEETLAELAENSWESAEYRLELMRALVAKRPKLDPGAFNFLENQLAEAGDPVRRLAAAGILRRSHLTDAQLMVLLKALDKQTLVSPASLLPALRERTTPESAEALLSALENLVAQGSHFETEDLENVVSQFPPGLQERLDALLSKLSSTGEMQRSKLAEYEPLLQDGDAERGRRVFFGDKAACASCHAVGAEGGKIGPDLTSVGAVRTGHDLLESILFPSSTFAQDYEPFRALTVDNRAMIGHLVEESPEAILLRDVSGAELRLHRNELRELERMEISLMPAGLETGLSETEFRDLLAFLQELK